MESKIRMAARIEGGNWNFYLAKIGTMDNSLLMASVPMSIILDEEIRSGVLNSMVGLFRLLLERGGTSVERFNVERAPEHERSGRS